MSLKKWILFFSFFLSAWGFFAESGVLKNSISENTVPKKHTASKASFLKINYIDQIEIRGAKHISRAELLDQVLLKKGMLYERDLVVLSLKNIQTLYFRNGFLSARVSHEWRKKKAGNQFKRVLVFSVVEGLLTKVDHTEVSILHLDRISKRKIWEKIKLSFLSEVERFSKKVFTENLLTSFSQMVQKFFLDQQLIGSRVVTLKVRSLRVDANTHWVELKMEVDLGERISFGFRGNHIFSSQELQKVLLKKSDQNAEEWIRVLKEKYFHRGYANVKITSYFFNNIKKNSRHVRFVIEEGSPVKIDKILFQGNKFFSQKQLMQWFWEEASAPVSSGVYVKEDVSEVLEKLVKKMKEQGFLSAKLIGTEVKKKSKHAMEIKTYFFEGERTFLRKILIEGNFLFSKKEILKFLNFKERKPLNLYLFTKGLERIHAAYREAGYWNMRFSGEKEGNLIQYFDHHRFSEITLRIEEGPVFRISHIQVVGLRRVKKFIVTRELSFQVGDVLRASSLTESEDRLRKLGLFQKVTLSVFEDPLRPAHRKIRIQVHESEPGMVGGGIGFRNDLGIRVFGQLGYHNIWMRHHQWQFRVSANRRFEDFCKARSQVGSSCFIEYEVKTSYLWPWFLLDRMNTKLELVLDRFRYEQFDARSWLTRLNFEKPISLKFPLVGGITYSYENTIQENATLSIDNLRFTLGSLTSYLKLDLRDHPLLPTRGFLLFLSYELSRPELGSQNDPFPIGYWRLQLRTDYHFLFWDKIRAYMSFRTGLAKNLVDPQSVDVSQRSKVGLPLVKQFALGGVRSMRGFRFQEINVQDQIVTGTLSYVNYRFQLDFPFVGSLYVGPFLDAGNLLMSDFSFGKLRYGSGIGVRWMTPLGPVNLDWGMKLSPRAGEDRQRIEFSIGVL